MISMKLSGKNTMKFKMQRAIYSNKKQNNYLRRLHMKELNGMMLIYQK